MSLTNNNDRLRQILNDINALPDVETAKEEQEKTIDITDNGVTEVIPDEGKVLSKVTVNVEVESGGNEEFVGIKYSDFTGTRGQPKIADARSLPVEDYMGKNFGGYPQLFTGGKNDYNGWCVFLETVYLNENTKKLYTAMFSTCTRLKNLHGVNNVQAIQSNCFYECASLTDFPYMPILNTIETKALFSCTGLTIVKLYNPNMTKMSGDCFGSCVNITDIYVPWAEGVVANAPWGAINATIHYNTVYDDNHEPIV